MARSHRRWGVWTAVVGCLVASGAVGVTALSTPTSGSSATSVPGPTAGVPTGPTSAEAVVRRGPDDSVRVLQMNLCNSGVAGCYTGRSVAEAAAVIRTEAPDVVTLNEICEDDVAVLERALADTGGPTASAFQAAGDRRTGGAFRCRNGRSYGIGVVARRGSPTLAYDTAGGLYPMQDTGDPEERAWVCLRPTGPGGRATGAVTACTTHLIDTRPTLARAQCAYLLGTAIPALGYRGGALPTVLAGDFNLRSGGSPDVRSCVPAGDRRVDDGAVQHIVATPELAVGTRRTIDLRATDHPGLLVTLTAGAARPATDDGSG